jgi:hypothetical protein
VVKIGVSFRLFFKGYGYYGELGWLRVEGENGWGAKGQKNLRAITQS